MDNSSVKKNIYRFRKAKGFTQEEMAGRIGISVTHYRNIESGRTWLISPLVGRIAEALGIDTDELLKRDDAGRGGGVLEDESSSAYGRDVDLTLARLQTELSGSREREADCRERIREMDGYIGDLRSTIEILKRVKGFENPEKI